MNKFRIILTAGAAMGVLAYGVPAAAHPDHSKTEEVRTIKIVKSDGKESSEAAFAADCGKGRKFESSVTAGDGTKEKRVSKMVICSDPDETDAKWEATLRQALADIETNKDMPADGKAKIVADLKTEIAKVGK